MKHAAWVLNQGSGVGLVGRGHVVEAWRRDMVRNREPQKVL